MLRRPLIGLAAVAALAAACCPDQGRYQLVRVNEGRVCRLDTVSGEVVCSAPQVTEIAIPAAETSDP